MITREDALRELARRELTRRGVKPPEDNYALPYEFPEGVDPTKMSVEDQIRTLKGLEKYTPPQVGEGQPADVTRQTMFEYPDPITSFTEGLKKGVIDPIGIIGPTTTSEKAYPKTSMAGQFVGSVAPYEGIFGVAKAFIGPAVGIGGRMLRGASIGTTMGAARATAQAAKGEGFHPEEAAKEGLMFAGLEALIGSLGMAGGKIVRLVREKKYADAKKAFEAAAKDRTYTDDEVNQVLDAIDKSYGGNKQLSLPAPQRPLELPPPSGMGEQFVSRPSEPTGVLDKPMNAEDWRAWLANETTPSVSRPSSKMRDALKRKGHGTMGVVAGVQPEYDEQGNPTGGMTFDPTMAALGLGLGMASTRFTPEQVRTIRARMKARKVGNINIDRMNLTSVGEATAEKVAPTLERFSKRKQFGAKNEPKRSMGEPITFDEIKTEAQRAKPLNKIITPQEQLDIMASTQALREQNTAYMNSGSSDDFVSMFKGLKVQSSQAAFVGRALRAHAIEADPRMVTESGQLRMELAKVLEKYGIEADQLSEYLSSKNFTEMGAPEIEKVYQELVWPQMKLWERIQRKLDVYRMGNMLSSPATHIINITGNIGQAGVVRPLTKAIAAPVDAVLSMANKVERKHYLAELPAGFRGIVSNINPAIKSAFDVFTHKKSFRIPDADMFRPPTTMLKPWYKVMDALESMDAFFSTLSDGAERATYIKRMHKSGRPIDVEAMEDYVSRQSLKNIFRDKLDPENLTEQGKLSQGIDVVTGELLKIRSKIRPVQWVVPFLKTPMMIFKRGMEITPVLGSANLVGQADKAEVIAQQAIGSMVMLSAASLAAGGSVFYKYSSNPTIRKQEIQAGKKPLSIKIGDNWVSVGRLGPLAYPFSLGAAFAYYHKQDPEALSTNEVEKFGKMSLAFARLFGEQPYVQGMKDVFDAIDEGKAFSAKSAAGYASQLVPMSSMLRWTERMVDPIWRDPSPQLPEGFIENIAAGIPIWATAVPPMKGAFNQPIKRDYPVGNAFSPLPVNRVKPFEESIIRDKIKMLQQKNKMESIVERNRKNIGIE